MPTAYNPAAWTIFFSTLAGVAAALTGLLFVSISINLQRILGSPQLIARAAKALVTLTLLLLAAVICLAPDASHGELGIHLILLSSPATLGISWLQIKAVHQNANITRPMRVFQGLLAQASCLPFLLGGISLVLERGGGLSWLSFATIWALLAAMIDAWVLLIEIQR